MTSGVQTSSYAASPAATTVLTSFGPTSCGVTWMYGVPSSSSASVLTSSPLSRAIAVSTAAVA